MTYQPMMEPISIHWKELCCTSFRYLLCYLCKHILFHYSWFQSQCKYLCMHLGSTSVSTRSSIRLCLECSTHEIIYDDSLSHLFKLLPVGFLVGIKDRVPIKYQLWQCMLHRSVHRRLYDKHSRWENSFPRFLIIQFHLLDFEGTC